MSSTTTIRLPERLKARVKQAARRSGKTPHSFILEAISEKTEQESRRADFHETADRRYDEIVATGKVISWTDMRGYLEDRVAGRMAPRPPARKLAR